MKYALLKIGFPLLLSHLAQDKVQMLKDNRDYQHVYVGQHSFSVDYHGYHWHNPDKFETDYLQVSFNLTLKHRK